MALSVRKVGIRIAELAGIWYARCRYPLVHLYAYLSGYKFTCRIQQFTDEAQPIRRDEFFRIQMAGRILTQQDNVDTDLRVRILDITDGPSKPQPVFSADEGYRSDKSAQFEWYGHYGVIAEQNTLLDQWVTVVQFPCHILRLACRGRRKLQVSLAVLEKDSHTELVQTQQILEYVYRSDGFQELHDRRLEVLQNSVQLAATAVNEQLATDDYKMLLSDWIDRKADTFIAEDDRINILAAVDNNAGFSGIGPACEAVLAFGEDTDRFGVLDLSLQVVSMCDKVTCENLNRLSEIADKLQIQRSRYLQIAQKILLASDCFIEDPSLLLGISSEMDPDTFRKQLNEEYRKWNARVTHPDPQIRSQADQMLSLIAEVRSRWLQSCS